MKNPIDRINDFVTFQWTDGAYYNGMITGVKEVGDYWEYQVCCSSIGGPEPWIDASRIVEKEAAK